MPRGNIAAFRPHWPAGLEENVTYQVPCDDEPGNSLSVMVMKGGGDMSVVLTENPDPEESTRFQQAAVRIRTFAGGGRHLRTHQALLWLALAIKMDNEELGHG
jgi:hypothetical protein